MILDVLDTKTMLTRHAWIWTLLNISKETKDQIFYTIDGDTPKEFSDMNVRISDDKGRPIDIMSLNVNKPYHKEFFAKITPVEPKKLKTVKLQYDWEEPEKNFLFRVPSDCKEMTYILSVPKGYEPQIKVLKVDLETGLKMHATPSPTTKRFDDKVVISWTKTGLKAFDAYQIFW